MGSEQPSERSLLQKFIDHCASGAPLNWVTSDRGIELETMTAIRESLEEIAQKPAVSVTTQSSQPKPTPSTRRADPGGRWDHYRVCDVSSITAAEKLLEKEPDNPTHLIVHAALLTKSLVGEIFSLTNTSWTASTLQKRGIDITNRVNVDLLHADCDRVLATKTPYHDQAHYMKGVVFQCDGDPTSAVLHYEQVEERETREDLRLVLLREGDALYELGYREDAEKLYKYWKQLSTVEERDHWLVRQRENAIARKKGEWWISRLWQGLGQESEDSLPLVFLGNK